MSKAAAKKTTTVDDELQQMLDSQASKTQFFGATLNLSWRLALTVLIPIFIGLKIDDKFNTKPSFVLLGFMIAVAGSCYTIWTTVNEVNQLQAEQEKKGRKKRAK